MKFLYSSGIWWSPIAPWNQVCYELCSQFNSQQGLWYMYLRRLVKDIVISSVTQSANLFTCGLNAQLTKKEGCLYSLWGLWNDCCQMFFIPSSISTPWCPTSKVLVGKSCKFVSLPCSRSVSLGSIWWVSFVYTNRIIGWYPKTWCLHNWNSL